MALPKKPESSGIHPAFSTEVASPGCKEMLGPQTAGRRPTPRWCGQRAQGHGGSRFPPLQKKGASFINAKPGMQERREEKGKEGEDERRPPARGN